MKLKTRPFYVILFLTLLTFTISGCAVTIQKGRRSDIEKIDSLTSEIEALNARLAQLHAEKSKEISELDDAKTLLEKKLAKEIGDKDVRLEMAERGLAIIFLAEVLFDSGKTDLKKDALPVLDKIAKVFNENLKGREIGVEGHTDNEPIKYSGWKSNWELSTARAISVLHYVVNEKGVDPKLISATGYGEHRPVASNKEVEGRRQNRRVELVVLPKNIEKIQADIDKLTERKRDVQKRLKEYKK
ncbi:MAG: OmpA family protein [Candidatus Omnitrophica bacterium]|nr:OmpA family protein [Candidatus Omnitrophota bacterium]MBU4457620.1 OmpA family protein [Candidatus Omnitrophota bacterium]